MVMLLITTKMESSWLSFSGDYPDPSRLNQCWTFSVLDCHTIYTASRFTELKGKTDHWSGKKLENGALEIW